MPSIERLLESDVELIPNDRDMSIGLIYDRCTAVVELMQRAGIWEADFFLKSAFKRSIQDFRSTVIGMDAKSAAFKCVALGDSIKFELIPESINITSYDYYMSVM